MLLFQYYYVRVFIFFLFRSVLYLLPFEARVVCFQANHQVWAKIDWLKLFKLDLKWQTRKSFVYLWWARNDLKVEHKSNIHWHNSVEKKNSRRRCENSWNSQMQSNLSHKKKNEAILMCGTVNVRLLNAWGKQKKKKCKFRCASWNENQIEMENEIHRWKCFVGTKQRKKNIFMIEVNSACAPEDKKEFITLTGVDIPFGNRNRKISKKMKSQLQTVGGKIFNKMYR